MKVWTWYNVGSGKIKGYYLHIDTLFRAYREYCNKMKQDPLKWTKSNKDSNWYSGDERFTYDFAYTVEVDESW